MMNDNDAGTGPVDAKKLLRLACYAGQVSTESSSACRPFVLLERVETTSIDASQRQGALIKLQPSMHSRGLQRNPHAGNKIGPLATLFLYFSSQVIFADAM